MDSQNIQLRSRVNPGDRVVDAVQIRNQTFFVDEKGQLKVITTYYNPRQKEAYNTDWFTQKLTFKMYNQSSTLPSRMILAAVDRNIDFLDYIRQRHDCSSKNSKKKACSHICLPTNVQFLGKCWCPTLLHLNQDGLTCS